MFLKRKQKCPKTQIEVRSLPRSMEKKNDYHKNARNYHSVDSPVTDNNNHHYRSHVLRNSLFTSILIILITSSIRVPNHYYGGCLLAATADSQFSEQPGLNAKLKQQRDDGSLQPSFVRSMDAFVIKENTQIGQHVYTLEAQLNGNVANTRIGYAIEGTQLLNVDKWTGHVHVAQLIDREQLGDSISFRVIATTFFFSNLPGEVQGPSSPVNVNVIILDENDNPPKIELVKVGKRTFEPDSYPNGHLENQTILVNISETSPPESPIIDFIRCTDVDKNSNSKEAGLRVECLDCEQEFELVRFDNGDSIEQVSVGIKLARSLSYDSKNNMRLIQIQVSDGKFTSSIYFQISIEDVQTEEPRFIGSTTCTVRENSPIDTVVMTIQAVDVDAISEDELSATFSASKQQQLSLTTNSVNKIQIKKAPGRQILYDLFNPSTGSYSSSTDEFKLHPLSGQLQVANKLDRESHLTENGIISFRVRARELNPFDVDNLLKRETTYDHILDQLMPLVDSAATSEADVTVILIDVNDNVPHWLNSSEISALNLNKSPIWYNNLPSDRNTGRMYRLQLRENSPPGTPITAKNEIFVYDLDNGQNANFNISLEDPFGLFDVEPKQVSGFSLVTLKLTNPTSLGNNKFTQRTRMLDYENHNERSFIVHLVATETNTVEKWTSKAQIHISVLDVNDNAPEFKEPAYMANIREDAQPGKPVLLVQALDRDEVSKRLTYSLHGKTANMFEINSQTGLVSVAPCEQPTTHNSQSSIVSRKNQITSTTTTSTTSPLFSTKTCLDYESQKSHNLVIQVSDGELHSRVPLTIYIDDVSDNPPIFTLPVVDVVIEEGAESLSPPIRLEAIDLDQTSMLTYSIIEGNFEGLFQINNITGELQLTRPIRIAHNDDGLVDYKQQQLNKLMLVIQASDGLFKANCTVRIDVLDANDNAPIFQKTQYYKELEETARPGDPVITVRAFDSDRGNNARVTYRIERGSYNQFEIDESGGLISVASTAQDFDSGKKQNYTLEVIADDHGLNPKSSSIMVHIHIVDIDKMAPKFDPRIQHTSVSENTLNRTIIHQMKISNEEERINQLLLFEPGPIEALDKHGQLVSSSESERLESMFSVSMYTGDVMINSPLDHDFAAFINLTIYVSRRPVLSDPNNPDNTQEATIRSKGYLTINVMDHNNNAPTFGPPWSPDHTDLSFTMLEELPIGSVLTQLVASDQDSKISHYRIEPPNDYFELASSQSGVIVNKRIIDYDAIMNQKFLKPGTRTQSSELSKIISNNIIQFNVIAYDLGLPRLSARATISVEILPVNDNDCKFEKQLYEVHIKENSPVDTLVDQVRATDLDYGEQHNQVSYQLIGKYNDLFNINNRSGLITVSKKGSLELDREKLDQSLIVLTVLGRDVGVENIEDQSSRSINRQLSNKYNSRIQVHNSRVCSSTLKIYVDDINDNPPLFMNRTYEVTAYDSDIADEPIIKLLVRDDDTSRLSSNSVSHISNSFEIISGNINNTFRITNTGLLYATKTLAQSASFVPNSTYELKVQVRQQLHGLGSFSDICHVLVHYVKTNRHGPEWRLDNRKIISVKENSKPGTLVTQLKCTDRDIDPIARGPDISPKSLTIESNNAMRYWLKENGSSILETHQFRLDSVSGNLVTKVELDREQQDLYQLVVVCEDNGKPQSLSNIASINIRIEDVNDNKPEFVLPPSQDPRAKLVKPGQIIAARSITSPKRPVIEFSVEEQQSRGLQVGELKALDVDLESTNPIQYCIIDGNEFQEFRLDKNSGVLYTNKTLDREKQESYELVVKAINDGSSCDDHIMNPNDLQLLKSLNNSESLNSNIDNKAKQQQRNDDQRLTRDFELDIIIVKIQVSDINDNAPIFKQQVYRAGIHHKSLLNTLVIQLVAYDPDFRQNGTLIYKITEILMYRNNPTHDNQNQANSWALTKPIKLIHSPFKIDQEGYLHTQQLLTQYQLGAMFLLQIEATEQSEPWKTARTKLEVYIYETVHQLKIGINLHPLMVDAYRNEIEQLLSNATKYTAIINRAKSYDGTKNIPHSVLEHPNIQIGSITPAYAHQANRLALEQPQNIFTPQQNIVKTPQINTNILLIFVDNFSIVNPISVMEKLDLTSEQLIKPHLLNAQPNLETNSLNQLAASGASGRDQLHKSNQIKEISNLIDRIALASIQSPDQYRHASQTFWSNLDWLENPSNIFVVTFIGLSIVGFIIFIFGCCNKSRIKDHIIKSAMDKLVKQQTMQTKINEQMLAATNHYNGSYGANDSRPSATSDHDFINSQSGFMSSFDATKGCIQNNYHNMNIVQRALDAEEFIDPHYNSLSHGQYNLASHFYDTSELEQQANSDYKLNGNAGKPIDDTELSITMGDDMDENGDFVSHMTGINPNKPSELQNNQRSTNMKHNQQRQRQQVPK